MPRIAGTLLQGMVYLGLTTAVLVTGRVALAEEPDEKGPDTAAQPERAEQPRAVDRAGGHRVAPECRRLGRDVEQGDV